MLEKQDFVCLTIHFTFTSTSPTLIPQIYIRYLCSLLQFLSYQFLILYFLFICLSPPPLTCKMQWQGPYIICFGVLRTYQGTQNKQASRKYIFCVVQQLNHSLFFPFKVEGQKILVSWPFGDNFERQHYIDTNILKTAMFTPYKEKPSHLIDQGATLLSSPKKC